MADLHLSEQEVIELKAVLAARRRAASMPWFVWLSVSLIVALAALLAGFTVVELIRDLTS
ncbi:MAG: hypothetical protein OXU92_05025 [Deltaproteobacteria bacterium]|nr:hypothetical protein [Deltaproteobacteria bacterium]